jgi:hypothetical protein
MSKLTVIKPQEFWDENEANSQINDLYDITLSHVNSTIEWYAKKSNVKAGWARYIRAIAIFLFIGSCIMPYISSMTNNNVAALYLGYIFAGLGGGILLFDKHFGFSSSWIRYILTKMALESLGKTFIERWLVISLRERPLNINRFSILIESLITFQKEFNAIVKSETELWAREFQETGVELAKALESNRENIKTQIEKAQVDSKKSNQVTTEIIEEAINRNDVEWKRVFKAEAIAIGKKVRNNQDMGVNCIVFLPSKKLKDDKNFIAIPPSIKYQSLEGDIYHIPTDVRAAGGVIKSRITAALLCDNTIPKRPGCSISRKMDDQSSGTLSLKLYKGNQPFILSCYHVLCAPELQSGFTKFSAVNAAEDTRIVSPSIEDGHNNLEIGRVVSGILNDEIDAAIATVKDSVSVSSRLCSINQNPAKVLVVTTEHVDRNLPVRSIGRTSGFVEGEIVFSNTSCDINYWIGNKWVIKTLRGIICTNQKVSGGDSGAVVVDEANNVIGIIAASSEEFAFVVPIQAILSHFELTLTQS